MKRTWSRWFAAALLGVGLASCGGGNGSGSGDADPPAGGPPLIKASLAVFPAGYLPAPATGADGGSALLLVSVSGASAGSANTTVRANGQQLSFDSASGTYRRWLLLSTREQLSLTVSRGTETWSASSALIDVYPQVISPRQRDNFPADMVVTPDASRGRPLHVSWTG